jgi:hypothetical protein
MKYRQPTLRAWTNIDQLDADQQQQGLQRSIHNSPTPSWQNAAQPMWKTRQKIR